MNFLEIQFKTEKPEPIKPQYIRIIDNGMPLNIIFLTYQVDILEILTGTSYSAGKFSRMLDKECVIINNGQKMTGGTQYDKLAFNEHETDDGVVQMATITISLRKI